MLTALASNANIDHPLLAAAADRSRRAGVLLITSDRGLCGGYNANAIKTAEQLIARLRDDGKQVALYVIGRKGIAYYRFRNRAIDRQLERLLRAARLRRTRARSARH